MKNRMRKSITLIFAAILLMGFIAGCGNNDESQTNNSGESKDKEVLKMATSADFPPFESRDEEGNFTGFDIELANIIAEELDYELEIEDMDFDGLVGSLQADRVDMVMAGMSMDEKRKKNVDFSMEYNRSGEMFLSKKDEPLEDVDQLAGKTVGVQLGTIQEEGADTLSEEYDFEVKKVDNASVLIQELLSNRIDVVYMDKEVALGYVEKQDLFGIDDPTRSSPGMGIAFPKGSDLVDDVNGVLEQLKETGQLQDLKDEWLTEEELE